MVSYILSTALDDDVCNHSVTDLQTPGFVRVISLHHITTDVLSFLFVTSWIWAGMTRYVTTV